MFIITSEVQSRLLSYKIGMYGFFCHALCKIPIFVLLKILKKIRWFIILVLVEEVIIPHLYSF